MDLKFMRLIALALCAWTISEPFALENGLARTPPMGFNTWNWFGCGDRPGRGPISEALIKSIADSMASNGMKAAGYQYVNIDDCWGQQGRDSRGGIVVSSNFPSGMKALVDYVHSKGLKLGVYSDVATLTCAKTMPGMAGHEQQDADTFVAWGIDYIKVDYCGASGTAATSYSKVKNALRGAVYRMKPTLPTAHEIVISVCNWGNQSPWLWGDTVGNLWRTTGDIDWSGGCAGTPCWGGVLSNMDLTADRYSFAGPGHWNDPDMLEVGNGIGTNEDRSHFSLWCMMAAPLIAGNDIRTMSAMTKSILTNAEAIAINQDPLGSAGRRLRNAGNQELWVKNLVNGAKAVCLFNRSASTISMSFTAAEIGMQTGAPVRDIWAGQDKGGLGATYATTVVSHNVALLRIGVTTGNVLETKLATGHAGIMIKNDKGSARIQISGLAAGREAFLQIFDLRGNKIRSERITAANGGTCAFSASDNFNRPLAGGSYFLRVSSGGRENSRTINVLR